MKKREKVGNRVISAMTAILMVMSAFMTQLPVMAAEESVLEEDMIYTVYENESGVSGQWNSLGLESSYNDVSFEFAVKVNENSGNWAGLVFNMPENYKNAPGMGSGGYD